jgi:hypothetical protein
MEIAEYVMTDRELNDLAKKCATYERRPWSQQMQAACLRITLKNLLNVAELNQDDMEDHTRHMIARAHQVLSQVYWSNQQQEGVA